VELPQGYEDGSLTTLETYARQLDDDPT
jgi:hypothetical protein